MVHATGHRRSSRLGGQRIGRNTFGNRQLETGTTRNATTATSLSASLPRSRRSSIHSQLSQLHRTQGKSRLLVMSGASKQRVARDISTISLELREPLSATQARVFSPNRPQSLSTSRQRLRQRKCPCRKAVVINTGREESVPGMSSDRTSVFSTLPRRARVGRALRVLGRESVLLAYPRRLAPKRSLCCNPRQANTHSNQTRDGYR